MESEAPSTETTRASITDLYASANDKFFTKDTKSSPLLATTPPTVSKALIRSYPYLLMADFFLGILTWTNDNLYLNLSVVAATLTFALYFEFFVTFMGHLLAVLFLVMYFSLISEIEKQQESRPTLDDIVNVLTRVSVKADLMLAPITSLNLNQYDIKRLVFTVIIVSPIYMVFSYFLVSSKFVVITTLTYCLTYHSVYSRVTRKIIWKSKSIRKICFYLTGINFDKGSSVGLFSNVMAKVKETNNITTSLSNSSSDGKPVRFTYVIYENQRKWIGIGWTSNLLNYERAPWTDEFFNECPPPEDFKLPDYIEDGEDLTWRWVDSNWRLDLTNDGALTLQNPKKDKTVDPAADDGFVYYDNTWKRPSSEDSFGKYTRRRRWLRTAELVHISKTNETSTLSNGSIYLNDTVNAVPVTPKVEHVQASGFQSKDKSGYMRRRSIRFDDKPTFLDNEPKNETEEKSEKENDKKAHAKGKENDTKIVSNTNKSDEESLDSAENSDLNDEINEISSIGIGVD